MRPEELISWAFGRARDAWGQGVASEKCPERLEDLGLIVVASEQRSTGLV
jgi:hypothetical protein